MARRFAKVSGEEIVAINEAAFFYPFDLVNTKTTIPLRVGCILTTTKGVNNAFCNILLCIPNQMRCSINLIPLL